MLSYMETLRVGHVKRQNGLYYVQLYKNQRIQEEKLNVANFDIKYSVWK